MSSSLLASVESDNERPPGREQFVAENHFIFDPFASHAVFILRVVEVIIFAVPPLDLLEHSFGVFGNCYPHKSTKGDTLQF